MHCEKDLCMTQKTLELLERHGFGAALQTKSDMVLRDLDIIEAINRKTKFVLQMTVTTADDNLCRIIEPQCKLIALYLKFHRVSERCIFNNGDICTRDNSHVEKVLAERAFTTDSLNDSRFTDSKFL
jgi:hypothetical protein